MFTTYSNKKLSDSSVKLSAVPIEVSTSSINAVQLFTLDGGSPTSNYEHGPVFDFGQVS